MPPGQHQPTPPSARRRHTLPTPGGGAQAVDATNGDFLWEFRAPAPKEGNGSVRPTPTRNIAIYDDKIYVTTGDARLIAVNARTGGTVWDTQVMDPRQGYTYTAGALAVKGVIISSLTGCQKFKNDTCYILGHDAQTGKELWRTSTIARPGEPGGDTWDNQPLMFRAGGDAWMTGSYDPATNLVYWGTAQAKPWAQFQRGTAGDALYTNSTLALDPKTGKMQWYFQHIPGETHDMDEVFERVLVDVNGRSSVFSMGKLAILWEVDRKTGQFVASHDPGYQTLIDVDQKTGRASYRPNTIPKEGVEFRFCPSTGGFKSLRSMAYHPSTRAFYIPLNLTCEDGTFGPMKLVEGGGGSALCAAST
jgi:alcohol dehydrogenase (cytochrome c)